MFKKIILGFILSLIVVGTVSAIDVSGFTVSDDFEDVGDGVFVQYDSSKNPIQILSIVEFNEHDADDYKNNDTENNYTVYAGENNTFNYVDGSMNEKGSFEFIEINNDKFIIDFSTIGIGDANDFNDTFQNLIQFNELNNITPINSTSA